MIMLENRASVAQQVEHPAVNRTVGSSSLSRGATNLPQDYEEGLFKILDYLGRKVYSIFANMMLVSHTLFFLYD